MAVPRLHNPSDTRGANLEEDDSVFRTDRPTQTNRMRERDRSLAIDEHSNTNFRQWWCEQPTELPFAGERDDLGAVRLITRRHRFVLLVVVIDANTSAVLSQPLEEASFPLLH